MGLIVESGLNGSLAMHVSNHCHDSLDEEGFHVSLERVLKFNLISQLG